MISGPAADSLRATLDRAFADPAYRWAPPLRPFGWLLRFRDLIQQWFDRIGSAHPFVQTLIIAVLVLVLVAICVHVTVVALRTVRYVTTSNAQAVTPATPIRDAAWFLAAADRLADEGRAAEAVVTAFQGLALEMAAGAAVRYHPSKTPREYAREARLPSADRERLGILVDQLYGYAFAGTPCGLDEYLAWRSRAAAGSWHAAA